MYCSHVIPCLLYNVVLVAMSRPRPERDGRTSASVQHGVPTLRSAEDRCRIHRVTPSGRTTAPEHALDQAQAERRVRGCFARGRRVQAASRREGVAVYMRAWEREDEMQGVWRGVDVRARPPAQPAYGMRRVGGVQAWPPTPAVQGVRRGVDMRARPPTKTNAAGARSYDVFCGAACASVLHQGRCLVARCIELN